MSRTQPDLAKQPRNCSKISAHALHTSDKFCLQQLSRVPALVELREAHT
jgi:hypothetical protein